jgi:histidinol phosphatase-like enzyme (inositol monophosphatase family)
MEDLAHRLDVAADAAWRAGRLTLRWFRTPVRYERKEDGSPVTQADREVEAMLAETLIGAFPEDGFLGEESGERPGRSGWRWIADPIDGTVSFAQGVPLYGTMVGLTDPDGEAVLGVVCLPALDEIVTAARGLGCRSNGRRVRVSDVADLADACATWTEEGEFHRGGVPDAAARIRGRVRAVRGWGDCYGHVLVATGRCEIMVDPVLHLWDAAPLLPIVEEAGGVMTDWAGERAIGSGSAISTNAALAAPFRALLSG